jgi:hypothetical protein
MGRGQSAIQARGQQLLFGPRGPSVRTEVAKANRWLAERNWTEALRWVQRTPATPVSQAVQEQIIDNWVAEQPRWAERTSPIPIQLELDQQSEQQRLCQLVRETLQMIDVDQPTTFMTTFADALDRCLLDEPAAGAVMLTRIADRLGTGDSERDFSDERMAQVNKWLEGRKTGFDQPLGQVFSHYYANEWLKRRPTSFAGGHWPIWTFVQAIDHDLSQPLLRYSQLLGKADGSGKIHLDANDGLSICRHSTAGMVSQPADEQRYCGRCITKRRQHDLYKQLKVEATAQRQDLGLLVDRSELASALGRHLNNLIGSPRLDEQLGIVTRRWMAAHLAQAAERMDQETRNTVFGSAGSCPDTHDFLIALNRWTGAASGGQWYDGQKAFRATLASELEQ